ncbi:3-oxoacyl-[acyl-carrier-protein] synthase III C-terminal domain-containing protein [Streptomyces sp. NBC_01435]|uniref:3-oxoacyl-[acyl-carrier-protein] synthase III C-terminal domain-containing protein n=1 Tax=Streptomyces sp. NBC_01435 TaxID=2903865 RepID=UPI003FCEDA04
MGHSRPQKGELGHPRCRSPDLPPGEPANPGRNRRPPGLPRPLPDTETCARWATPPAASIPLALADTAARRLVPPGTRTLITGFGAGLTWGSHTLTFPTAQPRTFPPHSSGQ